MPIPIWTDGTGSGWNGENEPVEEEVVVEVEVKNSHGLHARPAARVVNEANRFAAEIKLEKDGQVVNAKSIMNILLLAAECGSRITIRARGADAREAAEDLAALFRSEFGEPDKE